MTREKETEGVERERDMKVQSTLTIGINPPLPCNLFHTMPTSGHLSDRSERSAPTESGLAVESARVRPSSRKGSGGASMDSRASSGASGRRASQRFSRPVAADDVLLDPEVRSSRDSPVRAARWGTICAIQGGLTASQRENRRTSFTRGGSDSVTSNSRMSVGDDDVRWCAVALFGARDSPPHGIGPGGNGQNIARNEIKSLSLRCRAAFRTWARPVPRRVSWWASLRATLPSPGWSGTKRYV